MTDGNVSVPLTGVEVYGDITGRGARVQVVQTFRNAGDTAIEAVYKFPLPEQSAICRFQATIGDRIIEGILEEREKAFKIYDEALSQGDGAYLLDEERPNIFTLSVGNINPGSSVTIEIAYVILLDAQGPEVRFFLPTTISPRYIPNNMKDIDGIPATSIVNPPFGPDALYGLRLHIAVHGKNGIASLESPSHPIRTRFMDTHAQVEFAADSAKMDHDFILTITHKEDGMNRAFMLSTAKESFMAVDLYGAVDETTREDTREIIFVLDCSGSMNGSSIDEAKTALDILLKALEPGMRFNVYRFGETFEKLFPYSMPCDEGYLGMALRYLSMTTASLGGTEMFAPLDDIVATPVPEGFTRDIVIITDGEIANESEVIRLVQRDVNHGRVFAIGIGYGPNEYFIKQIARSSRGASELIAPNERIEPKVLGLYKKMRDARFDAITIQAGADFDQYPSSPVLFGKETISIFGRFTGTVKQGSLPLFPPAITVTGRLGTTEKTWSVPVQEITGDNLPIPLLWAREKIRELEEGVGAAAGSRQAERKARVTREQIVDLSRTYGIISRHTSYVAVEKREEKEKTLGEVLLRKIPVMLTKDWGGKGVIYHACMIPQFGGYEEPIPSGDICVGEISISFCKRKPLFLADALRTPTDALRHKNDTSQAQDIVLKILSFQRLLGGFELDADLARMLNLPFKEITDAARNMVCQHKDDALAILSTAIILSILESRFGNDRNIWETIADKSRRWLENEITTTKPTVDGLPVARWVEDFLRRVG